MINGDAAPLIKSSSDGVFSVLIADDSEALLKFGSDTTCCTEPGRAVVEVVRPTDCRSAPRDEVDPPDLEKVVATPA